MTHEERTALAEMKGYTGANRVRYTRHALVRMAERGAVDEDVLVALVNASSCRRQANGRFRVVGADRDGDELELIVHLEGDVLIVTLF